jgi:hypothetical protein
LVAAGLCEEELASCEAAGGQARGINMGLACNTQNRR